MKRPSIQFYPADWRKDPALRACSIEARGLWIDMICIIHESENYGFLEINSRKISEKALAGMCGITPAKCRKYLSELEENGVLSIDERGVVFSRRMVKDNELCEKRREAGKMGGNPALVKQKDNQTPGDLLNQTSNQNPTPSSSSSSSSSDKREREIAGEQDDWGDDDPEPETDPKPTTRRPTLAQALAACGQVGVTPAKADEWWNAREASNWIKGMAGGGTSPVGPNWQADMKTYSTRGGMTNGTNGRSKPDHRAEKASREYAEDEPHTIPIIRA